MKPEVPDRSQPVPAATGWLGRWGLFPIVAVTALVVAAIAVPFVIRRVTPEIVLEPPTRQRSALRFAWRAVPQADGYRVQVHSPAGPTVWTSPIVREPHVEWSEGAETGATYFWRVTALRGENVLAESPPTKFTARR
jgi:hypothetical protein